MQLTPLTPSLSQNGRGELDVASVLRNTSTELLSFSDAPHLDAQRIILHALKQREPSYLLAHGDDILKANQLSEITRMQDMRKTGMPLAYILGEADFYGRTFIVTPDVLIPRPDTELLIEKALAYISNRHPGPRAGIPVDSGSLPGMTIADIGTGSGCIAITLALELSSKLPVLSCKLLATDISSKALAIAKQNAKKHGVLDKIEFIQGDMLEAIKNRHLDLILSNPPYVPTEELATISARHPRPVRGSTSADDSWIPAFAGMTEKKDHLEKVGLLFEPRLALDGGPDGLQFVNQIKASGIPAIIETISGEIIELEY